MSRLKWDASGERLYETGVDRGVLYPQTPGGKYGAGEVWNGLTAVTQSPTGAEANPQFADNIKYLNLISVEEHGFSIEAYTYPDSFALCDGTATPVAGVAIGQQTRRPFGLSYRTRVGNDVEGVDHGYKIHLIYGCLAAPSEKAYATINDSPEAMTLSWEVTTTGVSVNDDLKPTAIVTIDSTKVSAATLKTLEDRLYGTDGGSTPSLPMPDEVLEIFAGSTTEVEPDVPTFDAGTKTVTIPSKTGVIYAVKGVDVEAGPIVLTVGQKILVKARPAKGYTFPADVDDDWSFSG